MWLARENHEIVLAVRSLHRGEVALRAIKSQHPEAIIEVAELDLSSLNSVRQFVADQGSKKWNLLLNNAGAKIVRPFKLTEDQFEWHTGVNHFGHFALTAGLWPSRATGAKVIVVSSVVAARARLHPASVSEVTFDEGKAYADSKLMNLLFATNLARLIDAAGVDASSVAVHPGFARAEPYGTKLTRLAERALAQSAKLGAQSIIAATKGLNGEYYAPGILQLWGKPKLVSRPAKALDNDLMKQLWAEAEEATNTRFVI